MAGVNPYIKSDTPEGPKQKFTLEFRVKGQEPRVVEIDPADLPSGGIGLPGSILDLALGLDIDIDHACGGVCACSTCHVVVREGLESCNESTEEEEDQLEEAPALTPWSRLACQCVPDGSRRVTVEIPNWNRNLVREGR